MIYTNCANYHNDYLYKEKNVLNNIKQIYFIQIMFGHSLIPNAAALALAAAPRGRAMEVLINDRSAKQRRRSTIDPPIIESRWANQPRRINRLRDGSRKRGNGCVFFHLKLSLSYDLLCVTDAARGYAVLFEANSEISRLPTHVIKVSLFSSHSHILLCSDSCSLSVQGKTCCVSNYIVNTQTAAHVHLAFIVLYQCMEQPALLN